jgi:putative membrane protein
MPSIHSLLEHWTLDPSLIYVTAAAILYWAGGVRRGGVGGGPRRRGTAPGSHEAHTKRLRELSFMLGLVSIVIALCSPIDYWSERAFWIHMGQHIILLTIAPPLILLGRPWPRMWRAIPLRERTSIGRVMARGKWTEPLRWISRPLPAFVIFNADMLLWHLPVMFNLTLEHQWIHNCEHTLFFFTGLLFWAHVVDPGPLKANLSWLWKEAYVVGAMVVGWFLAITLVLIPHPIYEYYVTVMGRPGGITALEDQQMAGGMMWVAGSISYTIAALYIFSRWAAPEQPKTSVRSAGLV